MKYQGEDKDPYVWVYCGTDSYDKDYHERTRRIHELESEVLRLTGLAIKRGKELKSLRAQLARRDQSAESEIIWGRLELQCGRMDWLESRIDALEE